MRARAILTAALATWPAIASAQTVRSGQWEIVTTVQQAVMPNAPPGAAAAMTNKPRKVGRCLTAAEANRGPQDIMKENRQCRFTRYSRKAGKLDSQMVCRQAGGTMTATSTGSFTATSFTTTAHMTMAGAQRMTMTMLTEGRRVGACAR